MRLWRREPGIGGDAEVQVTETWVRLVPRPLCAAAPDCLSCGMRARRNWTVEDVLALPGHGYELIDGQLFAGGFLVPDNDLDAFVPPPIVAPSLLHQRAVVELLQRISAYTALHGIGETLLVNNEG